MDTDGTVRRVPLAIHYQGEYYPSFALVMAKRYLDVPFERLLLDEYGIAGVKLDDVYIPTDDTGNLWIHYRGPGGSFPHISAVDVLEGTVDLSGIEDGIVLVGTTATGIGDIRVTPVSTVFPGVEIHATIIDNIISGDMFTMPGWMAAVHLLIIVVLGILTGLVLLRLGPFVGLVLIVLLMTGYFFGYRYLLLEQQLNIFIIYPAITLFSIYTSVTTSKYFAESQKKRYIHRAFSQYLSPAVIKELMDNPARLNLGGEERVLTAMFTDIAGFSLISEKMSPEEIVRMLNEYFTIMTEIIFAFNGTVDKYEGDAIMAFFGAPIQNQNHALETVRAAYYMQRRLEALRDKWERENSPLLHMRIGINTGPMVVGNLGSIQKMDYTVMGDAVNLAARFEPINKLFGTKIIIGDETKKEVEDVFLTRELDFTRVPGRSGPVTIYEVLDEKTNADEATREKAKLFAEGRKLFLRREFVKAKEIFLAILSRDESDTPSSIHVKRCEYLIENPPEESWEGIFDTLIK
jgi:adenylate cyclase